MANLFILLLLNLLNWQVVESGVIFERSVWDTRTFAASVFDVSNLYRIFVESAGYHFSLRAVSRRVSLNMTQF